MSDPRSSVRNEVARAVRKGILVRQPCVVSGCDRGDRADGHHEDYDKPLEVIWLCRLHHYRLHHDSDFRERVLAQIADTNGRKAAA